MPTKSNEHLHIGQKITLRTGFTPFPTPHNMFERSFAVAEGGKMIILTYLSTEKVPSFLLYNIKHPFGSDIIQTKYVPGMRGEYLGRCKIDGNIATITLTAEIESKQIAAKFGRDPRHDKLKPATVLRKISQYMKDEYKGIARKAYRRKLKARALCSAP